MAYIRRLSDYIIHKYLRELSTYTIDPHFYVHIYVHIYINDITDILNQCTKPFTEP